MNQKYNVLAEKFNHLQKVLQKHNENKIQRNKKKQEQQNDLIDSIQQKTDNMISKIEQLKRKQNILITMQKIQPSIPENFPKNYYIQLTYEDVVVAGNHKFIDFDQNILQEKFIIPLLRSSRIKVQVWTAQQQPVLFDKMELDLQSIVEECLLNGDKTSDKIKLNENSQTFLTYRIQLQGIGFSSWLKNINLLRQLETEKQIMKNEQKKKREQIKQKLQNKKKDFNKKFIDKKISETKEYQDKGIDQILNILADD